MQSLQLIGQGLFTGLTLSLMLGTVFFSLLRNSIQYGYKVGFYIAAGVVFCDSLYILVCLLSQEWVVVLKNYKFYIGIIGGGLLAISGVHMFFKASVPSQEGKLIGNFNKGKSYFFINGFLLNLLNPMNFAGILAISTLLTVQFNYSTSQQTLFFVACLFSVFWVEVLIAYSAHRIKGKLTPRLLKRINQLSGIVFFGIGVRLILGELMHF